MKRYKLVFFIKMKHNFRENNYYYLSSNFLYSKQGRMKSAIILTHKIYNLNQFLRKSIRTYTNAFFLPKY